MPGRSHPAPPNTLIRGTNGGVRPGSGRPKGALNKLTSTLRDLVMQAATEVGDSREVGKDGQGGACDVVADDCAICKAVIHIDDAIADMGASAERAEAALAEADLRYAATEIASLRAALAKSVEQGHLKSNEIGELQSEIVSLSAALAEAEREKDKSRTRVAELEEGPWDECTKCETALERAERLAEAEAKIIGLQAHRRNDAAPAEARTRTPSWATRSRLATPHPK
jgi:hypothetical protein